MKFKPWRYFLSSFVGFMLLFTWIPFSRYTFNTREFWVFPLVMGVSILLLGGGIGIGLWWAERD